MASSRSSGKLDESKVKRERMRTNLRNRRTLVEEKLHYDQLRNFFNRLVYVVAAAITLMSAVAIYFTYQSVQDTKREISEKYEQYIALSNLKIERIEKQAEIDVAEKVSSIVDRRLEESNVDEIVRRQLAGRFGLILESEMARIVSNFQNQIDSDLIKTTEMTDILIKLRGGIGRGMSEVLSFYDSTPDVARKLLFMNMVRRIGKDYDSTISMIERSLERGNTIYKEFFIEDIADSLDALVDVAFSPPRYNSTAGLYKHALCFRRIRELTGREIPTFDAIELRRFRDRK